jgi:hypothetical protein
LLGLSKFIPRGRKSVRKVETFMQSCILVRTRPARMSYPSIGGSHQIPPSTRSFLRHRNSRIFSISSLACQSSLMVWNRIDKACCNSFGVFAISTNCRPAPGPPAKLNAWSSDACRIQKTLSDKSIRVGTEPRPLARVGIAAFIIWCDVVSAESFFLDVDLTTFWAPREYRMVSSAMTLPCLIPLIR